jgi:outer membrane biosynthesis protein TonB
MKNASARWLKILRFQRRGITACSYFHLLCVKLENPSKMKRITRTAMFFLFAAAVLTACGGGESTDHEEGTEVEAAMEHAADEANEAADAAMEAAEEVAEEVETTTEEVVEEAKEGAKELTQPIKEAEVKKTVKKVEETTKELTEPIREAEVKKKK